MVDKIYIYILNYKINLKACFQKITVHKHVLVSVNGMISKKFSTKSIFQTLYYLLSVERAQARLARPAGAGEAVPRGQVVGASLSPVAARPVSSLSLACLKQVTSRLNDPRHQLLSLAGLSEEIAQVILEYLIKEKLLKPKTLNAFIPW